MALLEALVRVPTENPPGRELGRCAAVLCEALDAARFLAGADRARADRKPGGSGDRARQRGRRAGDRLLPRALRRRPGPEPVAVRARAPRREGDRARDRGHEGRPRLDALRGGGGAFAGPARRAADRLPSRVRRGDRQHRRLGTPARRRPDRSRGGRDADRRADRRRDLARGPRRDHAAGPDDRPRGARRLRPRGRERLRAHDPDRRAADRSGPRAAREAHELSGGERGGGGFDARGRRAGRRRCRLQRRARARRGSRSTGGSTPRKTSTRSSRA